MASFMDMASVGLDLGSFGLDLKNWRDLARISGMAAKGASSLLSKKSTVSSSGDVATTAAVEENRMQEGELYSLMGYLSAMYDDDNHPITNYTVKVTERNLFPAIVKAMKPGAGKLLMKTIGVSTTTVKKRRIVGYDEREVNGKMVRTPITEESAETVNLTGAQVVSALTWLATKESGADEKAKAEAVVLKLETFGIFTSNLDTAKELGTRSAEQLKQFMGWLDTHAHVVTAILTLGPKRLQDFLDQPGCDQALAAIKAEADLGQKRILQEAFQGLLVAESERINTGRKANYDSFARKGWLIVAGIAALVVVITGIAKSSWLIVAGIATLVVIAGITYAIKSLLKGKEKS